ncbi:aspartate/glutamate racemase family protein [Paenalcaligenes niemegkensis]|uniref:aspartate/glutamate racemase family protein n=1 Tax=Paenalcaligenes niemegkensis TaxID=2895469 RepID=UPI001EE835A5|nr:aspartate/glutamate racemase family protein [Paenalcaligenes niemegkensis]MCQ9617892.1 aspartate/glutamate racemase family protein [Paenalcaligenes niemegkensis]
MRLLIVNPNISTSVSELIEKEARRVASPQVEINVVTAPFGVAYIETRAEAAVGGYATLTALAEHYSDYDAAIVAAFGDPGLLAAREILPIPVMGMTESALMTASMLGGKISIVAISRRIRTWYEETVARYGMSSRLASIRCLENSLRNIATIQDDHGEQLITLCKQAVEEDGADVIIIAGAPLAGLARTVADRIPVPLVDGVSCAVRQAEAIVGINTRSSQAGSYAPPPDKPVAGLSPALMALIGRQPL